MCGAHDRNAPEVSQGLKVLLVPSDNHFRFGRQGTFQNPFIAGVGGFAASAFGGKK
jgi:hypothetical protein